MSKRSRSTRPHDGASSSRGVGVFGALRLIHPFDVPRHLHAAVIRAGVAPRSMIESGLFEQRLHALESLMLGPLARRR